MSTSTEEPNIPVSAAPRKPKNPRTWRAAGMVMLCFAASFFGAWLFLATGLVRPDTARSIREDRQTLVLQEGEITAEVFKRVSPSTVAITTEAVQASSRYNAAQISQGAGSGVIISKDGYIVTNKHVVPEGTNKVNVVLSDGKEYADVKVMARDPFNDIAFLKIDGVNDLTPAVIGDSSKVEAGQKVVAIGNALGIFRNSVTTGIISGIGRPVQAQDEAGDSENLENLFQTDAAINPGNSGGPLVNLKGEIIGINTAISEQGDAIGFAIPINDAKGMIDSMVKTGKIVKAYLGVRYVTITAEIARKLKLPVSEGVLVTGGAGQPAVVSGSPAAKAGLLENDIIARVDGQNITNSSGLASKMAQLAPGAKIELTIIRAGKEQKINVTLEAYSQ